LLTEPIEHQSGVVRVPQGPGLGIDVDRQVLTRFKLG
jgi:D-galactarolactone cycloisomerase